MNNTLIINGGSVDLKFAEKYIADNEFDVIMAVDGGILTANKLKLKPDYIIGDFDTASPLLLMQYENRDDIEIIRFRADKDSTDSCLAIKKAMELNSFSVHILGGTGSRMDHTLANVLLLQPMLEAGIDGVIANENNIIRLLGYKRKSIELQKSDYKYISLIPLSEKVTGISTNGMKYEITNFEMAIDDNISLGVSNEIINKNATVNIEHGKLLIIESRD